MLLAVLACRYLALASNTFRAGDWAGITSLPSLYHIDLHGNQLWGTIPSTISLLPVVTYLDASSNAISGSVPVTLSALAGLRHVHADALSSCRTDCNTREWHQRGDVFVGGFFV